MAFSTLVRRSLTNTALTQARLEVRGFSAKPPPSLEMLKPTAQEMTNFYPDSAFVSPPPMFNHTNTANFLSETCNQTAKQPTAQEPQIPAKKSLADLSDEQILKKLKAGDITFKHLDNEIKDPFRSVCLRRSHFEQIKTKGALNNLPFEHYDYSMVEGACGENVIGYVPVPVGLAGPMLLDGKQVYFPMATTEGCLIASTSRGCRAISDCGGAITVLVNNGITRAPLVRMPSVTQAHRLKMWLANPQNFELVTTAFNGTSRFARLQEIRPVIAGRQIHLRFKSMSGDAMGMNMISKAVEKALALIETYFPDMEVMSLSGNFCTDKKPSAVNWIEGRGKSVVAEARLSAEVVKKTLKTDIASLVDLNINKNLVGSALAGSVGGFNAHASNIVTAIFIATGQDAAQNVESSNCITLMESLNNGKELYISCTMPSVEVGTIGGGTHLHPQAACLGILDVKGSSELAGSNSETLARSIAAAVMAGELSLMSALSAGHLVQSHMKHNRKHPSPSPASSTH